MGDVDRVLDRRSLAALGGDSLVTLLGDRHADALALGQGNPRLGALADGEDVIQSEGKEDRKSEVLKDKKEGTEKEERTE